MGIMNKKIGDFTLRDAFVLSWLWNLLQIVLVVPLFFKREPELTSEEHDRELRAYRKKLETELLEREHLR